MRDCDKRSSDFLTKSASRGFTDLPRLFHKSYWLLVENESE